MGPHGHHEGRVGVGGGGARVGNAGHAGRGGQGCSCDGATGLRDACGGLLKLIFFIEEIYKFSKCTHTQRNLFKILLNQPEIRLDKFTIF